MWIALEEENGMATPISFTDDIKAAAVNFVSFAKLHVRSIDNLLSSMYTLRGSYCTAGF